MSEASCPFFVMLLANRCELRLFPRANLNLRRSRLPSRLFCGYVKFNFKTLYCLTELHFPLSFSPSMRYTSVGRSGDHTEKETEEIGHPQTKNMNRNSERNIKRRNQANHRRTPKAPEPEINLDMLWPPENDADDPYRDDPNDVYLDEDYPDDGYIDEAYLEDMYSEEDYIDKDYPGDAYSGGYNSKERKTGRKTAVQRTKPVKAGRRQKKKRFHPRRLLLLLVLLLAAGVGFWVYAVNTVYDRMRYDPIASVQYTAMDTEGVTNILLIGNDSREAGDDGRSDAMLLVSINNRTKKIYMTSFLRDMYVKIPGHKDNRLNEAYSFGGPELLMETIRQNFGIDVNRYVLVNFQAFAHLVDAAGGVDLELTNGEVIYVNGYLAEYNMLENRPAGTDDLDETLSGMLHLNGPQALAYCRNRYIGTDFARTERQRKVLSALVEKAPAILTGHFLDLIRDLPADLTTNLTKDECMRLSLMAPAAVVYGIEQQSIPVNGSYSDARIRDMAVLEVDFEQNRQFLRESIYGDEE